MMNIGKIENLWIEYEDYITDHKLTKFERQLLRKWIREGHSVYEPVDPQYAPGPSYPPMDFIEAYRYDRSIQELIDGMPEAKKITYLKDLYGYTDPTPEELAMEDARKNTPELIRNRVRHLERDLFHLWDFVRGLGLYCEAKRYVDELKDEEIPFEW